jgi:5'-3' exonuclease
MNSGRAAPAGPARARSRPDPGRMARVGSLMLLDSASLYFRAFYGIPPETMTAPDGTPINAVRGLLDMIARLVRAYRPRRLVACMDADWRPAFRVAAIPSYKAHRANPDGSEQVPDALNAQIPVIEQVLAAAGVVMAGARGYEADDIIGTLAARDDGPVDVVTGDRDLFQLVDDARQVRVIYTARGMSRLEVIDEAAVTRRYQIPGKAYAAFAALRGDPSDGLPGVPGVGEKTAAALVRVFGSVEAMLAALDQGHGGFPMGRRRFPSFAWRPTRRCRPRTGACRPSPPIPAGSPSLTSGGSWGHRWAVCAAPSPPARTDRRYKTRRATRQVSSSASSEPRARSAASMASSGSAMPRTAPDSAVRPSSRDLFRRSISPSL